MRTSRAAQAIPWLVFAASLLALWATPRWLPAAELSDAVVVEFAPDAQQRVEGWFAELPALRIETEMKLREVLVHGHFIQAVFATPQGKEAFIEMKSLCTGRQGELRGKSMAIYVIAYEPEAQHRLRHVAAELALREDGSALRSCAPVPSPRVSEGYRWLGLGPALAALLLLLRDRFRLPSTRDAVVKRTHLLPVALQLLFFLYWSLYWAPVREHAPSLVAQLMFAYVLDVLAAWWLRRPWPGLFAVGAPVLSANLFVWFTGTELWQGFLVIAIAMLSKALIRRGGAHIFNPSALGTSVLALLVVFFPGHFRHVDIASAISSPASMPELMFLATLVPLVLLGTSPIPIGAALALLTLQLFLGPGPGFTWPGWFLAVTIFAGDPATVPRTPLGRFLFGLAVGAGLQLFAMLLLATTGTDFWAKVLPIPLANLASPWLDRVGPPLWQRLGAALGKGRVALEWLGRRPVAVWTVLFLVVFLGAKSGGVPGQFHLDWGSPLLHREPDGSFHCRSNPAFCKPFRPDIEIAEWLRRGR